MNGNSGISLRLVNRYTKPVRLTALGSLADGNDPNGAKDVYEWDLSAETWNAVDTVQIEVKFPSASEFTILQTSLTDLSVSGVVRALNTLSIGLFNQDGNEIYIANSNIVYGDISLRLGNFQADTLKKQAYEHFVPTGSVLYNKYPTFASWDAEYGNGFDLLVTNTAASTVIATYGIGAVMPYTGSSASLPLSGAQILFNTSGFPPQQQVFSWNNGTSTGISQTFNQFDSDIWVLFPSGDANQIISERVNGIYDGDIHFHEFAKWSNLTTFEWTEHNNLVSCNNMFPSNNITSWSLYNSQPLTVTSGWKYPSIQSAIPITEINLDDTTGISDTMTFSDATDFEPLTSTAGLTQIVIEGKSNIAFPNTIWDYDNTPSTAQYFFQYNGTIALTSVFNQMFSNQSLNGGTFAFRFSSNTVSFDDIVTPIEMSGFLTANFSNSALTSFPRINYINSREVDNPTQVEISFNAAGNQLSVATVNQILIDFDNATALQTAVGSPSINLINQTPSAAPTGAGATAVTNLIARGFTVTTD